MIESSMIETMPGKRRTTRLVARFAALACLAVIAVSLGGCSKCGWLWESGGKLCTSDVPR